MTIAGRRITAVAAALGGLALLTALRWAIDQPWISIPTAVLAIVAAVATTLIRRAIGRAQWRASAQPLTSLNPSQFEHYLAALCRRDGCRNVEVVGGAGDLAADVLATTPGRFWWQVWRPRRRRILIQAKRYAANNPVKSEHVQCVNGTYRDYHRCDHAAVVTTSRFTAAATEFADHVGITLVDERRLTAWIGGDRSAAPWN